MKKKRGVAFLALGLLAIGVLLACVLYTCSNRPDYDDEDDEETTTELSEDEKLAEEFADQDFPCPKCGGKTIVIYGLPRNLQAYYEYEDQLDSLGESAERVYIDPLDSIAEAEGGEIYWAGCEMEEGQKPRRCNSCGFEW